MTHNKFIEVMQVPVLSTAHLPSNEAIEASELLIAPYEGGWFVWIGYDDMENEPPWMPPVRAWALRICPSAEWLRFDSCGENIYGLEEFVW